ncbi:hypothetical protein THASP1DRAFT_25521 [Thamnocephalis sphaerospora]|uniref:Uncharacterized protein n=1 Tax=Thamnocephalis sphaerospora TaxID=78915 RepID=A0A4P9XK31_9FUNG|nr:hypothetical protein THASP1DRAFT_25521 [Thamnocephalis sphaerospora]|eukprot:RKP06096.1 hypothetical protein THASP1DRAFT_25521 [Thamnocephalis sphaerospora]
MARRRLVFVWAQHASTARGCTAPVGSAIHGPLATSGSITGRHGGKVRQERTNAQSPAARRDRVHVASEAGQRSRCNAMVTDGSVVRPSLAWPAANVLHATPRGGSGGSGSGHRCHSDDDTSVRAWRTDGASVCV